MLVLFFIINLLFTKSFQMKKLKLYIAISLDGKIAKPDGSVEWLESIPNPGKTDYGYAEFYDSIDTTIQGYSTYKQILGFDIDFPYAGKKNYVVTRKQNLAPSKDVEFITKDHAGFIKNLKKEAGKDIWLIGGGQINSLLLKEQLIDEILVFVMPIILSDGVNMFETIPIETSLKLLEAKPYESGAVELRYLVK